MSRRGNKSPKGLRVVVMSLVYGAYFDDSKSILDLTTAFMFFFLLPAIANSNASNVVREKDGEQVKQPCAHGEPWRHGAGRWTPPEWVTCLRPM